MSIGCMHDSIACGKRDNGYCDGGEATFIRYFAEVMAVMATEKTSSLLEFIRTENLANEKDSTKRHLDHSFPFLKVLDYRRVS